METLQNQMEKNKRSEREQQEGGKENGGVGEENAGLQSKNKDLKEIVLKQEIKRVIFIICLQNFTEQTGEDTQKRILTWIETEIEIDADNLR